MNPELEISLLTPENWQECHEIKLRALRCDPASFGESYDQEAARTEGDIRIQLNDPYCRVYVARIDKKPVALVVAMLLVPKHVIHMARLGYVFTDPEFRRLGIGEKLLAYVINDLKQNPVTTRVALSVGADKTAARKLYEKLGFKEFGFAHNEMRVDGKYIDQVHMELLFEGKAIQ
ncbi:MAG TPA: N-acetyltransferase [Candidatus Paceibacterota bacterium]|nr:N-acetyltransferase [Candidatus Paceibacterota bacterium]